MLVPNELKNAKFLTVQLQWIEHSSC